MFSFDSLTNNEGQKINLNPIYQSINALEQYKLDKTEYNKLFDGLSSESQKKLTNYIETSREVYFMNAIDWLYGDPPELTPFNSGYFVAKSEQTGGGNLYTSLNYNFNANYNSIPFNDVLNAALDNANVYKNRIELTGNLNFSAPITCTNENIKTIIFKNKNVNNTLGGVFDNYLNRLIDIDGFVITNLEINNSPGFIKIKNCENLLNPQFKTLGNVNINNIGIISRTNTNEGGFSSIDNLNLNYFVMPISDNLYFHEIKNLTIENATIIGKNNKKNIFNSISNATFNNVMFDFSLMNTKPLKPVFDNAPNYSYKRFGNWYFNKCSFTMGDSAYFAGINGTLDNCVFTNLKFERLNELTINIGNIDEITNTKLEFIIHNSFNTIDINNYEGYLNFYFSVSGTDNVINFKNKYMSTYPYAITIDEGTNRDSNSPFSNNVYNFENDKNVKMSINYGGNNRGSSYYRHPKIILGKSNNAIKFNCPHNTELRYNTFDIHFNDTFRAENFDVDDIRKITTAIKDYDTADWSGLNINNFNLYFNINKYETIENGVLTQKPIYMYIVTGTTAPDIGHTIRTGFYRLDYDFYTRIEKLFGGDLTTNTVFETAIYNPCVRFYNSESSILKYSASVSE